MKRYVIRTLSGEIVQFRDNDLRVKRWGEKSLSFPRRVSLWKGRRVVGELPRYFIPPYAFRSTLEGVINAINIIYGYGKSNIEFHDFPEFEGCHPVLVRKGGWLSNEWLNDLEEYRKSFRREHPSALLPERVVDRKGALPRIRNKEAKHPFNSLNLPKDLVERFTFS